MATVYSRQFISCVGVHAAQPVEQPLNRPQHRVEKRALALENTRHVDAQGAHQRNQNHKEDNI